MSVVLGLLALGFALIALEIVIPGGIVGIAGGLSLIFAVVFAYQEFGFQGALVTGACAAVGVIGCLIFEFKVLPKTPMGKRFFLQKSVVGKSQPDLADVTWVGKEGRALTALAPSGYISVDGRKFEASSRSGFVAKGEKVRIDGFDTFKVTVSKI